MVLKNASNLHLVYPFENGNFGQRLFELKSQKIVAQSFQNKKGIRNANLSRFSRRGTGFLLNFKSGVSLWGCAYKTVPVTEECLAVPRSRRWRCTPPCGAAVAARIYHKPVREAAVKLQFYSRRLGVCLCKTVVFCYIFTTYFEAENTIGGLYNNKH